MLHFFFEMLPLISRFIDEDQAIFHPIGRFWSWKNKIKYRFSMLNGDVLKKYKTLCVCTDWTFNLSLENALSRPGGKRALTASLTLLHISLLSEWDNSGSPLALMISTRMLSLQSIHCQWLGFCHSSRQMCTLTSICSLYWLKSFHRSPPLSVNSSCESHVNSCISVCSDDWEVTVVFTTTHLHVDEQQETLLQPVSFSQLIHCLLHHLSLSLYSLRIH